MLIPKVFMPQGGQSLRSPWTQPRGETECQGLKSIHIINKKHAAPSLLLRASSLEVDWDMIHRHTHTGIHMSMDASGPRTSQQLEHS